MPLRIAIIEDHADFRESISLLLGTSRAVECIGEFSSVEEALREMHAPDIVLLDIHLPRMSGIEGIPRIKAKFPDTKILMLTVYDDDQNVFNAILAGADGYLLKKTPPVRLLQAVQDAADGGSPMTPSVAKQALSMLRSHLPQHSENETLTTREHEILQLLVEGFSNEDIAERLYISWQTVRNHIRHIYEKLHVHSKSQAVVKALRQGYL